MLGPRATVREITVDVPNLRASGLPAHVGGGSREPLPELRLHLGDSDVRSTTVGRCYNRALSLLQPWTSLVAFGLKRFETRSWGTSYRGPIAIHASKSREALTEPGYVRGLFDAAGLPPPPSWPHRPEDYPLGRIVAVATLEECWRMTPERVAACSRQEAAFGAWSSGRFA